MTSILLPGRKLMRSLDLAVERIEEGKAQQPVLISSGVSYSVAQAFADKVERKGFIFEARQDQGSETIGDLLLFYDPSGPHEQAANVLAGNLASWLWPWCNFTGIWSVLVMAGNQRVRLGAGFREPDQSLYLRGAASPNLVIEVAYSQSRADLLLDMARWTAHAGPARVAIGVDVQYAPPPNEPPRIEVFMQLAGRARPSATVGCGAGSGCVSPAMREHTIFVPLQELLYGVAWLTRLAIILQLAVTVPTYSVLCGGAYAVADVLRCRRSLWQVARAGVRSLAGPWWGVVPLDTFVVQESVFSALGPLQ